MAVVDRIKLFWHLLRADSPAGAQVRRRVLAMGGIAAFLLVLLASIGLLRIVLVVAAGGLCATAIAVAATFGRRATAAMLGTVRRARRQAARAVAVATPVAAGYGSTATRTAARISRAAARNADAGVGRLRARSVDLGRTGSRQIAVAATRAHRQVQAANVRVAPSWPTRTPDTRRRDALHANADGLRLRRAGAYDEAVEQHRLALDLFRELGDRRSEALTLNSLALALDRAGDQSALDLLEEAAAILGELGDEHSEGEVIANLALAFRRRGRTEQSAEVFDLALRKLEPDSQAYRKVENLLRAS
jgi:tetratricopeptide (TPR) repeat protein